MSHSESNESSVSEGKHQVAIADKSQDADATQDHEDDSFSEFPLALREKPRWPLILGLLLLVTGAGFGWYWWQTHLGPKAGGAPGAMAGKPPGVPVQLATVETGRLEDREEFIGTLEAPRAVELKPEIDGRVTQILVKEGDRVRQGQVIFRLDSDDVQAQLMQAKAGLDQTQARLAELQAGTRPEEIAQAKARLTQAQARLADAKAGARPEEIAQAQSQIDAARADADLAQAQVRRYSLLRQEGVISANQLDEYIRQQRSANAKLQEAERRLEQLRKSRSSDINELAAAVEQEQQNLKQLENGPRQEEIAQARSQVSQAAAQVQATQVKVNDTKVVAPFTGIIGDIPIKSGDYVSKGDILTSLTENNALELNLSIPLEKASQLRAGLPVELLDAKGKPSETGRISFISPQVNPNSQTVLAKATFFNENGQLLNSQFVKAQVIWQERPGILIPVAAVSRLGGETFVFVAERPEKSQPGQPQLIAKQKPVKLGAIQGNHYQVLEGLKAGDQLVISGILNLTDGAPIMPAP